MKVVIVGVHGHMGIVFRDLERCPGVEIVGIAPGSPDEDVLRRAEMWKPRFPHMKVFEDYRKMADEVKPDIAAVGSYYYLNGKITIEMLQRGIHCLSEKPSALTLEGLQELRSAYGKSGVEYAAMLEMRYHPPFLAAYNEIRKGSIGQPLMATAQKTYKLGERSYIFRNRSCYGGTIPFVGIHGIDLLMWVMGSPVETIFARHTRKGNRGHGELESCAVVSLSFSNKTFASANIDFLNPEKAPAHSDDRIRIAGEKGVIEVKDGKTVLMTNDAEPVIIDQAPSRFFFPDFISQIEKRGSCLVTAQDSFLATEVVLNARLAADREENINIGI